MFPIYRVPEEAAEISEQMGTKFKFWYRDEQLVQTLFKEGRPGTGENWAEKITAEFAELLGVPHAKYDLATWKEKQGIITPIFLPESSRLIHGNELVITKVTTDIENSQIRYIEERRHLASRVFQFMKQNEEMVQAPISYIPIPGVSSALGVFIGYLLFDAWIANQDRHSENWGIVLSREGKLTLAPTYDHGSSLGRHEIDSRKSTMMSTKDRGASIEAYVQKARSKMYPNVSTGTRVKPYLTTELFKIASNMDPIAARAWLQRLQEISFEDINGIVSEVPAPLMSTISREFTTRLLKLNLDRLLALTI